MKITFINGSPNSNGCVNYAFNLIKERLNCETIQYNVSSLDSSMCVACRACKRTGKCCDSIIETKILPDIESSDAIIVGSPVYYGGITAQLKNFLTKLFYSHPKCCEHKPIGLLVSSRRSGSLATLNELSLPFLMHSGIIIGSTYWNEIYGNTPKECELDYEGIQTLHNLADNIKYVAESLSLNINKPKHEKLKHLNFISREYISLLNKE